MKILGIETSCDETACAIVEDGRKVLANTVASQIDLHAKTGGVVPEVAAREHVLKMTAVLDECLEDAAIDWDDIDAVAVTKGPGLVSSLIIGTQTANAISYVKNKPLIPVQHIVGHIYGNWLVENDTQIEKIEFPLIVLTVSGGHNDLILMRDYDNFELLGESLDDAAGEAFDKVARVLGLGYPGGPVISKIAEKGDKNAFDFPRPMMEKGNLNFSFSGLKTAVINEVKKRFEENGENSGLDEDFKANVAAGFQEAVCDVLSEKLLRAYAKFPEAKELHLAGGVSANLRLRELVTEKLNDKIKLRYPQSIKFCTDNAAMIAAAAYFINKKAPQNFRPKTNIIPSTSFEI